MMIDRLLTRFLLYSQQTLEDMDLIFGDTAAHEEKERIVHIEAELRGHGPAHGHENGHEDDEALKKPSAVHGEENV